MIKEGTQIKIILDGVGAFPELSDGRRVHHIATGSVMAIAALPKGMESGRTSVAMKVDLTDGSTVFIETSLRLFLAAADALRARYPQG